LNWIIPILDAKGVHPTVLYLTNDPWFFRDTQRAGRQFARGGIRSVILNTPLHPPPQGFWTQTLPWVAEPVATLNSLRSGHKEVTLERTINLIGPSDLVPVRVMRALTLLKDSEHPLCVDKPSRQGHSALYQPIMSWWLSPITQRVLDAQLCDQENINALSRILERLERNKS
jgi:hypothetical protein